MGRNEIVERVGVSKPTVIAWKKRYAAEGLGGLDDRPKPGRPRQVDEIAVVQATLEPPPARLGVTHWSTRLLAEQLGTSNDTIANTPVVVCGCGDRDGRPGWLRLGPCAAGQPGRVWLAAALRIHRVGGSGVIGGPGVVAGGCRHARLHNAAKCVIAGPSNHVGLTPAHHRGLRGRQA